MKSDLIKILKIAAITICFSIGLMIGNWFEADVGYYDSRTGILAGVSEQLEYTDWLRLEVIRTQNIVGEHRLTLDEHNWFTQKIVFYALQVDLPPSLLAATAAVESSFRTGVVSHAGASGILQVMPELWWDYVTPRCGYWRRGDAEVEICAGAYVLRHYVDRCDGEFQCALSRYNSGWIPCEYEGQRRCSTQGAEYAEDVLALYID